MKIKTPQRKTRREKKIFKRAFYLYTIAIIILIIGFFVAMNHSHFALSSVQVQGQKTFIEREIQDFAESYLEGKYFGIVPRDNFLFFNTRRFTHALERKFSRLESISTNIEQGDTLVIIAGERLAHSLWCIEEGYESLFDEECYFADSRGVFYAQAPYFSGKTYFKVFFNRELISNDTLVGESLYTPKEFSSFFDFLTSLESTFDMNIFSVSITDSHDTYVFLSRIKETTYRDPYPSLIFQRNDDYQTILRNIEITFNFDIFKKDFQQKAQLLESVDVRFPGRIFYTFN